MARQCHSEEPMKPRFDTVSFLWLAVVLFVALTIAFLLPITPQDYWWYLRVGQDTLASGSVPRLDTFTFTRSGSPVDYQSWGAAVIFFLIHRLGGFSLTVLFRAILLAVTYGLVWMTARQAGVGRLGLALGRPTGLVAHGRRRRDGERGPGPGGDPWHGPQGP